MTDGTDPAAQWWSVPPLRQVSYLVGADPELLGLALDPLPDDAPAVVQLHPAANGRLGDYVDAFIVGLDKVAIALFPRWLPGAERLDRSGTLGGAAVRALAVQAATQSSAFGPFLIDLAERGLSNRAARRSRFPAEVQAAGLARVLADAYGRHSTVLLIDVPEGLSPASERVLVAAAEWLAHNGRFTVWLAGKPLQVVDRIRSVVITLPTHLRQLAVEAELSVEVTGMRASSDVPEPPEPDETPSDPVDREAVDVVALTYPPVSGSPRQDSAAEQALERGLAPHEWAQGRRWNNTYEWHILGRPYRLDLFWPDGGLVVEVDGPEHRGRLKYADDRLRDVNLQLCGYDVLRFTNEQVLWDVQAVVTKIEQLLNRRRAAGALNMEMAHHAEQ